MNLFDSQSIEYRYQWGHQTFSVLKGASFLIPPRSFCCLVGPSGVGKTTLLNLMGLLDHVQGGRLCFEDRDVSTMSTSEIEKIRLREIGFIFQAFYLIPTLSALENTSYFLLRLGHSRKAAREIGEGILEKVGLAEHRHKRPLELSGGQRQRVAIARALAKSPQVILADEPTANLDRKTAEGIIALFKELHDSGKMSFIFSTHDTHLVSYADQVFRIVDGLVEKERGS